MDNVLTKLIDSYDVNLQAVEDLLATKGFSVKKVKGALRVEMRAFGAVHAIAYLVPATAVLLDNPSDADAKEALQQFQEDLVGTEFFEVRGKQTLLIFFIGDNELLVDEVHRFTRSRIEHDASYAAKVFLPVKDLLDWIAPPFAILEGAARANAVPELTTIAELPCEPREPLTADTVFDPRAILENAEGNFMDGALPEEQKRVANAVYRRIAGPTRKIVWSEDGPELASENEADSGTPIIVASSGERDTFAYAVFLAKAASAVTPGMCVGLRNSFSRLDSLRRIAAMDCLADFVIATGASVQLQSAREDVRNIMEMRTGGVFKAAAELAEASTTKM